MGGRKQRGAGSGRPSFVAWHSAWLWVLACSGEEVPQQDVDSSGPIGPFEHRFAFVIIADPHIAGPVEHETRLERVTEWIDARASERDIQLVLVLGDIGWGDTGLARSHQLLDELPVPWVPIIGDNVIVSDQDAEFATTFEDQYSGLAETLDEWVKAPTPVWDPNHAVDAHLQNFRFDHGGVRFVALDWNIRGVGGLAAEFADLHDYEGGTWPFLEESVRDGESRAAESIVLLSHIPLMAGALSVEEVEQVNELTAPLGTWIHAAYAGHMHVSYELYNEPGGYEVLVTDATWDDENYIRLVDVQSNGREFSYTQELIEIDE